MSLLSLTEKNNSTWTYMYCIYNRNTNCSYVGVTNDLQKRIRQHNGEIKGGARYTRSKRGKGKWKYAFVVAFATRQDALRVEWKMHHIRGEGSYDGANRRFYVFLKLVCSTKKATSTSKNWSEMFPLHVWISTTHINQHFIEQVEKYKSIFNVRLTN